MEKLLRILRILRHSQDDAKKGHLVSGKRHKESTSAAFTSRSVASFFEPQVAQNVIEAETRWSMYVAKHNLAFLNNEHASKLFAQMFPDSEIARKFACGRTKTTAIEKEALSPYYHAEAIHKMSNPFSVLMDESNDKQDKSCIILVRVLDAKLGNVKTRFLDMPVVNIGTAEKLFSALKESWSNTIWILVKQ